MCANRIQGPNSPDPSKSGDQKVQREAKQRVEKVGEVDPDEQARGRRFQKMMQKESDESPSDTPSLPSPFEPEFHRSANAQKPSLDSKGLPSPSHSPPPNVSASSSDHPTRAGRDLPKSEQFWEEVDLPDQPLQNPRVHTDGEKEKAEGKVKGKPVGKQGKKPLEPSPFEAPEGSRTAKKSKALPDEESSASEARGMPSGKYWTSETAPVESDSEQTADHSVRAPKTKGKPASHSHRTSSMDSAPSMPTDELYQEKVKKQTKPSDIIPPALPGLPEVIQAAAVVATNNATLYLSPEMMPLFFQMVGSMLIMSNPPGINRTEITLNNPAFANSKFFGSTIEITKFSTAPDSFNIRLTGSNEAVAAFNQNIPSLMAAFQTGHFKFRVGRIDADYATDRPLFRRKGSAGESDQEQKGR